MLLGEIIIPGYYILQMLVNPDITPIISRAIQWLPPYL